MERLAVQIALWALATLMSVAGTAVYFWLKREITRLTSELQAVAAETAALRTSLRKELNEMQTDLQEAKQRTGVLVPPSPPKSGFNLNKRSQALRMSRLGEKPENIASALGLPRQEIELLMKIQKIVITSAGVSTS